MVILTVRLLLRDCLLVLLYEEQVFAQHFSIQLTAELLHVEQQSFQGLAESALIPVVIFGEGEEFPLHGLLEDAHVYFLIEGQKLLLHFLIDQYFVEVQHPFFDLVVYGDIVEEFREVGGDEFL